MRLTNSTRKGGTLDSGHAVVISAARSRSRGGTCSGRRARVRWGAKERRSRGKPAAAGQGSTRSASWRGEGAARRKAGLAGGGAGTGAGGGALGGREPLRLHVAEELEREVDVLGPDPAEAGGFQGRVAGGGG